MVNTVLNHTCILKIELIFVINRIKLTSIHDVGSVNSLYENSESLSSNERNRKSGEEQ